MFARDQPSRWLMGLPSQAPAILRPIFQVECDGELAIEQNSAVRRPTGTERMLHQSSFMECTNGVHSW